MTTHQEESSPTDPARGRLALILADVLEAIRGSRRDFTREPLGKSIFLLAVPMVLETSMHSLFAVFDAYFVGRLGASAVATVGVTESLLSVVFAVSLGLSMGATAMVARRVGEKDPEAAAVVTVQAIGLGLLLAIILGLAGALNSRRLLELMGAGDDILEVGSTYATITYGCSGTILMLFLINATFRGAGDPALALRSLAIANLANIVLDPLFIFGLGPIPAMGVTGAAVATTLGRSLGLFYQLWVLVVGERHVRIRLRHLKVIPEVMLRLLRISGIGIFQMFVATSSFTGLVRVITPYSAEALAGYTIALRVIVFILLPAWGMGNAIATLVGQNLGAGRPERAERCVWVAARYNLVFLVSAAVVFIVAARSIVGIFSDSATVVAYGADCLRIVSLGYFAMAYGMVMISSFNGAGDTTTPTWINIGCHWLIKIPLAWALTWPLGWGPRGVFTAIPVAEVAVAMAAFVLFRRGRWKNRAI